MLTTDKDKHTLISTQKVLNKYLCFVFKYSHNAILEEEILIQKTLQCNISDVHQTYHLIRTGSSIRLVEDKKDSRDKVK